MTKRNYSNIKTLSELRMERIRMAERCNTQRERLVENYNELSHMFSISYVSGWITEKITSLYTVAGAFIGGLKSAMSFFFSKSGNNTADNQTSSANTTVEDNITDNGK